MYFTSFLVDIDNKATSILVSDRFTGQTGEAAAMSTSAPEFIQRCWDRNFRDDEAEKAERCEAEALRFFNDAVKDFRAAYRASIVELWGDRTPRANRARDAIKARWDADTAPARALMDRTFECLMATGELSEELDAEWSAITPRPAQRVVRVGDHDAERSAA